MMASVRAWASWRGSEPAPAEILPASIRRRTSLLTRATAEVYGQILEGRDGSALATVFGSAHGEVQQAPYLLDQIADGDAGLSPIRFSGSVHNAASGYITLALGAQGFTTSVSAGDHTVAAALTEALALAQDTEVAVIVGDVPPHEAFLPKGTYPPFAAGLLLGPPDGLPRLANLTHGVEAYAPPPPHALMDHPCRAACQLLAALESGGRVPLTPDPMGWSVEVLV